jgi:cyclophilin family peptidyl-prolyl cis-trans isomerase/protein-disulfide isomerase
VKNAKLFLLVSLMMLIISGCNSAVLPETEEPPAPTEQVPTSEVADEVVQTEPTCVPNPPPSNPSPDELIAYSADPENDWIKGSANAAITVIEYADFQCPYCSIASQNLNALLEKYPDDVRIVYRHFPLASIHDKAILGAQASEAAGLQGEEAFWAMHDLLYATQADWSSLSVDDFGSWLVEKAGELELDPVQFETDLYSETRVADAEATWTDGQALGIPGTPYIRINSLYEAQADPQMLTAYVEMIKLESLQYSVCPPMVVDPEANYQAIIETEAGNIVIDLFPDVAPLAVNSFIFLAENEWFDGVTFHRVLPGFVAQTGDPTGTGYGGPGYRFSIEASSDIKFDKAGLVAMANSGPESNGSQFFITYSAAPNLDGAYSIFGEVSEGMDIVEKLTPRDPQPGVDLPPGDILLNITIEKQ